MGKKNENKTALGLIVLIANLLGLLGSYYIGWVLFGWVSIVALIVSFINIKSKPSLLFIFNLIISLCFSLIFLYLFLGYL